MSHLKSLMFCTAPTTEQDPKLIRRQHLIEKLEEQRALAKDPDYVVIRKRINKNTEGMRVVKEEARRVRPWWKTDANGLIVLAVRNGFKPIEFEKGKAGIVVGTKDKLEAVLGKLIDAAKAGELDAFLEKREAQAPSGSAKKAA